MMKVSCITAVSSLPAYQCCASMASARLANVRCRRRLRFTPAKQHPSSFYSFQVLLKLVVSAASMASTRLENGKPQDRVAGGKEEYNAFFYSLVSTDTLEMYYSTKRQQIIIDQRYSFKVITSLPPADTGSELSYHRLDDHLALLGKVLSAGDNEVGLEQLEEDVDDIALQKARRSAGSMSMMSGANKRIYMEYRYTTVLPTQGSN